MVFAIASVADRLVYDNFLNAVSSVATTKTFTITSGETAKQVADDLNSKKLIRSSWAMQLYLHAKNLSDKLQVGIYNLSPNQSTPQIAEILTSGKVQTNTITFIPGKTIFQLKSSLLSYGYTQNEIDYALNIDNYRSLALFQYVPKSVSTLEGLIWPDSFYRNLNTPLSSIITEALNETDSKITPSIQASFAKEGLTVYQGLVLSSIINQEVSNPSDQTKVAQVFLSRLKTGMPLGSDVTAYYGAAVAGVSPSVSYDSIYNTRIHPGLPPTPISNFTSNSLFAAANPANTNYLYFVTGDNGTTYFSTTYAQQQANTTAYCHKLCALP